MRYFHCKFNLFIEEHLSSRACTKRFKALWSRADLNRSKIARATTFLQQSPSGLLLLNRELLCTCSRTEDMLICLVFKDNYLFLKYTSSNISHGRNLAENDLMGAAGSKISKNKQIYFIYQPSCQDILVAKPKLLLVVFSINPFQKEDVELSLEVQLLSFVENFLNCLDLRCSVANLLKKI